MAPHLTITSLCTAMRKCTMPPARNLLCGSLQNPSRHLGTPLHKHSRKPYFEGVSHLSTSYKLFTKDSDPNSVGVGAQNAARTLLESWFYEVCNRGSLTATLPFHTVIKPLHPQMYPDMNKVILQLHFDTATTESVPTSHELSEISDLYNLQVEFDKDKANMNVSCEVTQGVTLPVACSLQVPLNFDLKVQMSNDASLSVEKLESSTIVVEVERGDCHFHGLKCGSVSAICQSGNIKSSSTLLGNVYFHTGQSGCIDAGKLQGSSVSCETVMGSVDVRSLYSETATFRSEAGNVQLGNCHGQLCVQAQRSQLKIESLEGDLDASVQTGNVDVHISKHTKVDIELKTGDISLSFPPGASSALSLGCPQVTVDPTLQATLDSEQHHQTQGSIGEGGPSQVNARTMSGTISLKQQDWIQTTKLASFMRDD